MIDEALSTEFNDAQPSSINHCENGAQSTELVVDSTTMII